MARFRLVEPEEKAVYVALGSDQEEGLKTLRWTLQNWKSHPISVVILHIDTAKDTTVKTYYGKMPASSMNDKMLVILRKIELQKMDNLLSSYKALCGKVKAEVFKIDKYDKPARELIIDLVSALHITHLVMGLTFMKSSFWRVKSSAIGGCFYIHQRKPEYCEFFIVSGGKQIILNEARFLEFGRRQSSLPSSSNPNSPSSQNQWQHYAEEMDLYLRHLLSLQYSDEQDCEQENIVCENSPIDKEMKELRDSKMSVVWKSEHLKRKLKEVNEAIRATNNEVKFNRERLRKANFAISLCCRRAEETETLAANEATKRSELKSELNATREFLHETLNDINEGNKELRALALLRSEILESLRKSSEAMRQAEEEARKATLESSVMVSEIDELKQQRDVFRRRVESCGAAEPKLDVPREFSGEEISAATEGFSERLRLKSGGDWSGVYEGRLGFQTVAIKVIDSAMPDESFRLTVKFLGDIRHPHVLATVGFCSEPKCIVFEYMHNGSLRDVLQRSSTSSVALHNYRGPQNLPWTTRIRILAKVGSGLCHLSRVRPRPTTPSRLSASNILLDRNLVPKISGFQMGSVADFGLLLLQLLTGSNWAGSMDREDMVRGVDLTGGEWPLEVVQRLASLAIKCLTVGLGVEELMGELEELRGEADGEVVGLQRRDSVEVPSVFLCPILQEVMENPHIAADGFSYEHEAIQEWLKVGRDTSPLTNLKLNHNFLTPNYTLRSLIQAWLNSRSNLGP